MQKHILFHLKSTNENRKLPVSAVMGLDGLPIPAEFLARTVMLKAVLQGTGNLKYGLGSQ